MTRNRFRIVTGWYPSRNTAEKIFDNVKAKYNTAQIEMIDGYFTVLVKEFANIQDARKMRAECIDRKIPCGIEVL